MEIVALPLMAVGPALVLWWGRPAAMARRGRNAWVGMRTPRTMESDRAWRVGHQAAWPVMWVSSLVSLLVALGAFVVLLVDTGTGATWLLPVALIGGTLLWGIAMVVGAVVADRAAGRVRASTLQRDPRCGVGDAPPRSSGR